MIATTHPSCRVGGPVTMLAATVGPLRAAGFLPLDIQVALERYTKCGMGHCGYVNHRYVCADGPVFSLAELLQLPEALHPPAEGSAEARI